MFLWYGLHPTSTFVFRARLSVDNNNNNNQQKIRPPTSMTVEGASLILRHRFLALDGEIHQIMTTSATTKGRIHISVDSAQPESVRSLPIMIRLYDNTEPTPTPMKVHSLQVPSENTTYQLNWPLNHGIDRCLFQVYGWNGLATELPTAIWITVRVEDAHILQSPPYRPCVFWGDDAYRTRPDVQQYAAIRHELERITKIQSPSEQNIDWSLYDPARVAKRAREINAALL